MSGAPFSKILWSSEESQLTIHENTVRGALMADVPVSAQGANPTASDSFGQFTLQFPHKRIGEAVQVLLRKDRYVVVNDVQSEVSFPANPETGSERMSLRKLVEDPGLRSRAQTRISFFSSDEYNASSLLRGSLFG
jgi:hypothetical protein